MLFIPFDRVVNWARPPIITILLILMNVFIYFTFQSNENKVMMDGYEYYIKSGLNKIEYPFYEKYKEQGKAVESTFHATDLPDDWIILERDKKFQDLLNKDRIISPSNEQYEVWREKRDQYDLIMAEFVTKDFRLVPNNPTVQGLFGHQFLHGSVDHLLGNMLFLFCIGFLVEATIGAFAYFILYLIGGLGAGAMFIFLNPESYVPLVGASGAIAGLMGLYTVFYGFRKIRFFYFVIVYFNFIKLPAIAMLPVWIGKEVYMMISDSGSNIAYAAHFGGLVMGAVAGVIAKKTIKSYDENITRIDQEKENINLDEKINEAIGLCLKLEHHKAKSQLKRLHQQKPQDPAILFYLQQCYRFESDQPQYKIISQKLFSVNKPNKEVSKWIEDAYLHYNKVLEVADLPINVLKALANTFLYSGNMPLAQKQINSLIKKDLENPMVQQLIERLINLLKKNNEQASVQEYLKFIRN